MSNSSVREAFVWSVAWRPVSLNSSHESTVPKTARSGSSALRSQPLDLGPREVGIEHQPGALADQRLVPCRPQLLAALRRATVLPDQGAVDRLPRRRVPGDHGLALVGDPDPVELGPLDPRRGDRLGGDPPRHLPDLPRVVLDPARPRKVLPELRVGTARDPPLAVEDEAGGPGRPLVDREDHPRSDLRRPGFMPGPRLGDGLGESRRGRSWRAPDRAGVGRREA